MKKFMSIAEVREQLEKAEAGDERAMIFMAGKHFAKEMVKQDVMNFIAWRLDSYDWNEFMKGDYYLNLANDENRMSIFKTVLWDIISDTSYHYGSS